MESIISLLSLVVQVSTVFVYNIKITPILQSDKYPPISPEQRQQNLLKFLNKNSKIYFIINAVCSAICLSTLLISSRHKRIGFNQHMLTLLAVLSVWITSIYYRIWKGRTNVFWNSKKEMIALGVYAAFVFLYPFMSMAVDAQLYRIKNAMVFRG